MLLELTMLLAMQGPAPVVINEFGYDDSGTDDYEYVELYNTTNNDINIGDWELKSEDQVGPNTGFKIPANTMIKAKGFYVFGSARVPHVDQVVGVSNIWENDQESLTLEDNNGRVIDTLVYEGNKGYWNPALAEGEGIWGNHTGVQPANVFTALLLGRNEVPATPSAGYGRAIVRLEPVSGAVSITAICKGVPATAAHLHRGIAGVNGPVVIPLSGGPDV
jgi:hypothetical protein